MTNGTFSGKTRERASGVGVSVSRNFILGFFANGQDVKPKKVRVHLAGLYSTTTVIRAHLREHVHNETMLPAEVFRFARLPTRSQLHLPHPLVEHFHTVATFGHHKRTAVAPLAANHHGASIVSTPAHNPYPPGTATSACAWRQHNLPSLFVPSIT